MPRLKLQHLITSHPWILYVEAYVVGSTIFILPTLKPVRPPFQLYIRLYDIYKRWPDPTELQQHNGFLWISGKPGAGKSSIMKFIFTNMKRKSHKVDSLIASFFSDARGDYLEKSITGMYRSLLLQLLEGYPDLQKFLDDSETVSQSQNGCPPLN
jgi:hypothetical protein